MRFSEREHMLDQIQSEIKNSESKISNLIKKNEMKKNGFLSKVNKNLIDYQKSIFEQKIKQLEYINNIYEYLEENMNTKNKKKLIFQQEKLDKLRTKLKKEIEKYLDNI